MLVSGASFRFPRFTRQCPVCFFQFRALSSSSSSRFCSPQIPIPLAFPLAFRCFPSISLSSFISPSFSFPVYSSNFSHPRSTTSLCFDIACLFCSSSSLCYRKVSPLPLALRDSFLVSRCFPFSSFSFLIKLPRTRVFVSAFPPRYPVTLQFFHFRVFSSFHLEISFNSFHGVIRTVLFYFAACYI